MNLPLGSLVVAAAVALVVLILVGGARRTKAVAGLAGFLGDVRGSFVAYWREGRRTTLIYAVVLTAFYWTLRLCAGPLAFTAVGWSGDWLPVVRAQLLLVSFVLPFAP